VPFRILWSLVRKELVVSISLHSEQTFLRSVTTTSASSFHTLLANFKSITSITTVLTMIHSSILSGRSCSYKRERQYNDVVVIMPTYFLRTRQHKNGLGLGLWKKSWTESKKITNETSAYRPMHRLSLATSVNSSVKLNEIQLDELNPA